MPRLVIVALFALGCSKSATNQDTGSKTGGNTPDERIAVPTGAGAPEGAASKGAAVDSPQLRLSPDEGKLAIEAPADAKAGAEVVAKVMVVANPAFKVNLEFPTSIKLEAPPQGVTIAKAELKAGGQSKAKGDADVFDDKQATFLVKLTPAASGTYTINGNFKFAVCDRAGTQCFPKKEPIAIQIAAK